MNLPTPEFQGNLDVEILRIVDNRYDDIKNGKVKAIDGEEAFARLRDKSRIAAANAKKEGRTQKPKSG